MSGSVLAPLLVVITIVAVDCWVLADANQRLERGRPVVFRAGSLAVDTPLMWFVACLLLWIVFFPLYLTRRR